MQISIFSVNAAPNGFSEYNGVFNGDKIATWKFPAFDEDGMSSFASCGAEIEVSSASTGSGLI